MSIIIMSLLLSATQDIPGLVVRESRPPSQTRMTYEATCGSTRLRVENFGHARPLGTQPRIFINGRRVTGGMATALERDLKVPRALYRFSARCPQESGELQFEIYTAVMTDGDLEIQAARATFLRGALIFHDALSPVSEDTFWFS